MGDALLFTADGNNNKAEENIIDPSGRIVASKRFDGAYANQFYFYRYDIRGSVTNITDSTGAVVKGYEYDAYGNTVEKGDAQFKNSTKFTGAVQDKGTGLYYMNARHYNPSTGRFLQQDTESGSAYQPWTQNLYTYCGNNPINMIDPTGHSFFSIFKLINKVIAMVKKMIVNTIKRVLSAVFHSTSRKKKKSGGFWMPSYDSLSNGPREETLTDPAEYGPVVKEFAGTIRANGHDTDLEKSAADDGVTSVHYRIMQHHVSESEASWSNTGKAVVAGLALFPAVAAVSGTLAAASIPKLLFDTVGSQFAGSKIGSFIPQTVAGDYIKCDMIVSCRNGRNRLYSFDLYSDATKKGTDKYKIPKLYANGDVMLPSRGISAYSQPWQKDDPYYFNNSY